MVAQDKQMPALLRVRVVVAVAVSVEQTVEQPEQRLAALAALEP